MPSLTRDEWMAVEAAYQALAEPRDSNDTEHRRRLEALAPHLRAEVEAMVGLGPSATQFLRGDALRLMERAQREVGEGIDAGSDGALLEGATIGPYTIVRELGRGGMGSVHLAERTLAGVVQQVAFKRIDRFRVRPGLAARFAAEQRVLASLDHPGIARLLDVGMDERVGPYLVMEFVDGARLDRWCDGRRLELRERAALLASICDAVHAAHQRLIAHRDLKPANVLVTREGVAKLVDFGIAGVLSDAADRERSISPAALTPAYASPEQRAGAALSTASDIYSLGVIAHELFAGCLPATHGAERRSSTAPSSMPEDGHSMAARWRSLPPQAQASIADCRSTSVRRLDRELGGELGSIVRKATACDPADRYATAAALAEDLRRSLRHEVIAAAHATPSLRLRKLVRRHRAASIAAAIACVAIVGAGVTAVVAAVNARRAEVEVREALRTAETEASVARSFNDFVIHMLTAPSPMRTDSAGRIPRDTRLADVLGDAIAALPTLRDRPEVEARVTAFLAMTHAHMGDATEAARLYQRALELQISERGANDPEALSMRDSLGSVLLSLTRIDEARSHFERVLQERRRTLGPDDPLTLATLNNLAQALAQSGRSAEALPLLQEVVARRRASGTLRTRDGLASLDNLALALIAAGRAPEALPLQAEALEGLRELLGDDHPDAINALGNRAFTLFSLGDVAAAATLYEEVVARWVARTSPTDPRVPGQRINLASCLERLGRVDEALRHFDLAITALPEDGSLDPSTRGRALTNRAIALRRAGRLAEAEAGFQSALAFAEARLPPSAPALANARAGLGGVRLELGRAAEAVPLLAQAADASAAAHGEQHPRTRALLVELGDALERAGRHDDARRVRARLGPA